jgi:hypothetical protein
MSAYLLKENHYVGANRAVDDLFDDKNATKQWFNTLTGEFTDEEKYVRPKLGFWEWRPWREEADAVLIVRNLERKEK